MQNRASPPVFCPCRAFVCLNVPLDVIGVCFVLFCFVFPADKMYLVPLKERKIRLWVCSARTHWVASGTSGQSPGNDAAWDMSPAIFWDAGLPRLPQGVRASGSEEKPPPWIWGGKRPGSSSRGGPGGATPPLEAENSVSRALGWGRLLWANDQLGNLCQIRESRDKSLLSAYKNTTFTYLELPTPPSCGSCEGGAEPLRRQRRSLGWA